MYAAFDIDATLDGYPQEMLALMQGLKTSGHRIAVLTGTSDDQATQADWNEKAGYLVSLGLGECWDDLVVFSHNGQDEDALPNQKAQWCVDNGVHVFVDNNKSNARAAVAAGVPLVMVPWATRTD